MKNLFVNLILALVGLTLIVVVFVAVRQGQAKREIEAEWQASPPSAPDLAETSQLEIVPLYEKTEADDGLMSGHGISYLVRTDAATVLLDLGNNPDKLPTAPFLTNMRSLGLQPEEIDAIVVSHPHPDHIGGLDAWRRNTISFGQQESGFGVVPKYLPIQMNYAGANYSPEPALVSQDTATTGVISFPELLPLSILRPKSGEQALVVNVADQGLVLVTGCGHPTVEKLVTRAETLYGRPVIGVVGGLHLNGVQPEVLESTIAFMQSRAPALVSLSPHDSGAQEIAAFQSAFPEAYQTIQIGKEISFP